MGPVGFERLPKDIVGVKDATPYLKAEEVEEQVRRRQPSGEYAVRGRKKRDILREEPRSLPDIESAIRGSKTELLRVVKSTGEVVLERQGETDRISIRDLSPDLFRGNIIVHNHPNGDSFSRSDVQLLLNYKAAQIRAVADEYTYMLDLPADTEWEDVEGLVVAMMDQVQKDHAEAIESGTMTFEQSERRRWHDVWSGVTEVRGWQYGRIPSEWNT